jgi:hypothetical protein
MADVSAMGVVTWFYDSEIFPNGFPVTQYGDGADAITVANVGIATSAMDVNGNMITYAAPEPGNLRFVLAANTEGAKNMRILIDAHRAVGGRQRTGGEISITVQYPNGDSDSYTECILLNAPPSLSVISPGRYKNLEVEFSFKDVIRG